MRAAKKAGHTGKNFRGASGSKGRFIFDRGRRASLGRSLQFDPYSQTRRPNNIPTPGEMPQCTKHHSQPKPPKACRAGNRDFFSSLLKREGVTRDGQKARMFDAASDHADAKAFAERCEGDRHHFRFTVSPEDATQMADLHAFARELMTDAERDLGTKLNWIAVDYWNTDNLHIHVQVRGRSR
jgi:hypothetical protein